MLIEFTAPVRRATMRRLLADTMRQAVAREGETPTTLVGALEAIGYWIKWKMPARELERLGVGPQLCDRAEVLAEAADIVRAAVEKTTKSLRVWAADTASLRKRRPRSMADASDALKERMRADAVLEGIEWMYEHILVNAGPRKSAVTRCDLPPETEGAFDGLSDSVHDLDSSLQRYRWEISVIAHTSLLSSMRAAIPDRQWLPWWLSGTLELLALARLTPSADHLHELWQARESTMRSIEYRAFTEMLESAIVTSLHGRGIPVDEPTSIFKSKEGAFRTYDWLYKSEGEKCRVRLVAPSANWGPAKRKPGLQLQLDDIYAARQTRLDDVASRETWHLRNLENGLVGRMMFVNGLMFRWIDMGDSRPPCAKLPTRRSPALPESGQMIMVDCQTGEALKPLAGR